MIETTKNTKTVKTQTKVYDHLFIAIFGKDTERSKRWRLELYNALIILIRMSLNLIHLKMLFISKCIMTFLFLLIHK